MRSFTNGCNVGSSTNLNRAGFCPYKKDEDEKMCQE